MKIVSPFRADQIASGMLSFSERQRDILGLLAQGKSNKEIAYALGITEGTVKQHLFTLFRKIGVTNRTKAVLRAEELIKSGSQLAIQDKKTSTQQRIDRELPQNYAWRMVTAVCITPRSPDPKTPAEVGKIDQALQALREEAQTLIQALDGQILISPGAVILAVFGAPRSHLDDAARGVFFARKITTWLSKSSEIPCGIGIATAATIVGFSDHPLYRSQAFDISQNLSRHAPDNTILATDVTCKSAGSLFPYKTAKIKENGDANPFLKEIPIDTEIDAIKSATKINLPFMSEIIGKARNKETQWLGIEAWPPSASINLMDAISIHADSAQFKTYRLRLATAPTIEQTGDNIFHQLNLVARIRERSEGNESYANAKTNIMSAVKAIQILCMRGPTALIVYGLNGLQVMMTAFGARGLEEISRLPLIIVASTKTQDEEPHITAKILNGIPGKNEKVNAYRMPLKKDSTVRVNGVNTDLITMLDTLSAPARHAVRVFVESKKSSLNPGEREIGQLLSRELLISGLFKADGNLITYRDDITRQALIDFFTNEPPPLS